MHNFSMEQVRPHSDLSGSIRFSCLLAVPGNSTYQQDMEQAVNKWSKGNKNAVGVKRLREFQKKMFTC